MGESQEEIDRISEELKIRHALSAQPYKSGQFDKTVDRMRASGEITDEEVKGMLNPGSVFKVPAGAVPRLMTDRDRLAEKIYMMYLADGTTIRPELKAQGAVDAADHLLKALEGDAE